MSTRSRTPLTFRRGWCGGLAAAVVTLAAAGCGTSDGSREAFCEKLSEHRATYDVTHRIATQARSVSEGVGMAGGPIAARQLVDTTRDALAELRDAAPTEIRDDVTQLADRSAEFSCVVKQTRGMPTESALQRFDAERILQSVNNLNQFVVTQCAESQPLQSAG